MSNELKVIDPFMWIPGLKEAVYLRPLPDGSVSGAMRYARPETSHNHYESLETSSFRECLNRCVDEAACDAAEYFEATRSCHLLRAPFDDCVFPSRKPTHFAARLPMMATFPGVEGEIDLFKMGLKFKISVKDGALHVENWIDPKDAPK